MLCRSLRLAVSPLLGAVSPRTLTTSLPVTAARKGTRERKKAKLVKKEQVKKVWVPERVRRAELLNLQPRANRRFDRESMPDPVDDVYLRNWFKWQQHDILEALAMHRETHHPTMYNRPDELVFTVIELDMQLDKKTRFADRISQVVSLPYRFPYQEPRSVVVFCQSPEQRAAVAEMGLPVVGGTEIIKQFQNGSLLADDFDFFVAHPEVMSDLLPLRGLLRRRFPSVKDGSVSAELVPTIERYVHGLQYETERDDRQLDFASVTVPVGRLSMELEQTATNLTTLLRDIESNRPRNHSRDFITRVSTWCEPGPEKLDIDFQPLLSRRTGDKQAAQN